MVDRKKEIGCRLDRRVLDCIVCGIVCQEGQRGQRACTVMHRGKTFFTFFSVLEEPGGHV